jgi:hypothetical protein
MSTTAPAVLSSIGMISPLDYALAHQDDPHTQDPDAEVA